MSAVHEPSRAEHPFDSCGTRCAAWLYTPRTPPPHACIVVAHGFSGTRDQRLDAYAERFAAAGLAVLLFDYRYFGASDGEPRQLIDIHRQLEDWQAAIAAARALPNVDSSRVAVFGSSFSGGHVQRLAARDPNIAAVIAQVPFCDGLRNLPALGIAHALSLIWAGLRDAARALLKKPPLRIPAVGKPGTLAVMTTPDAEPGFLALNPPDTTWRNEVCARITLSIGRYRPGKEAGKIRCPILYAIAERDLITPAAFAHEAARRAAKSEVVSYQCGHFDPYVPPFFDEVVSDQTEFLRRHLGLAQAPPA